MLRFHSRLLDLDLFYLHNSRKVCVDLRLHDKGYSSVRPECRTTAAVSGVGLFAPLARVQS